LRVVISIGGAGTASRYFSDAALTATSRRSFVASCVDMFLEGNLPVAGSRGGAGAAAGVFDGIDVDWEYPNCGCADVISRPADKQNLTLLLAEFRAQLNDLGAATGRSYTTSAAISSAPSRLDAGYEVNRIFTHLNWVNVMTYNMHGPWQSTTNHQAPIWSPSGDPDPRRRSIDQSIKYLVEGGATARKLALGVPFFGRGWTGVTNANRGLYQRATGPAAGDSLPYRERSTLTGYGTHRDRAAGAAWLFNGNTFYNLDDPEVIRAKLAYVVGKRLAGAMVWALDQDTDDGELIGALDALNTGW
jgi:chitinase